MIQTLVYFVIRLNDRRMSLGQFQGERSLREVLQTMRPLFLLPLHEYEMTHDHGGNRTGHLLQGGNLKQFDNKQTMPMLWGEDFHLAEDTITFTRQFAAPRAPSAPGKQTAP